MYLNFKLNKQFERILNSFQSDRRRKLHIFQDTGTWTCHCPSCFNRGTILCILRLRIQMCFLLFHLEKSKKVRNQSFSLSNQMSINIILTASLKQRLDLVRVPRKAIFVHQNYTNIERLRHFAQDKILTTIIQQSHLDFTSSWAFDVLIIEGDAAYPPRPLQQVRNLNCITLLCP